MMQKTSTRMVGRTGLAVLVAGIIMMSLLVLPASAANLATPVQVMPANNQQFYHYPPVVFWTWKPVDGANQYICEVEIKSGSVYVPFLNPVLGVNYFEHSFLPTKSGRWRVTANDTTGKYGRSEPSPWRTFTHRNSGLQLAVPRLVSPMEGTVLSVMGKQVFVTWKPVSGAAKYQVDVQIYDVNKQSWMDWTTVTTTDGTTSYAKFYHSDVHELGRWRVTALAPAGTMWRNSPPSGWRNYYFV